MVNYENAKIYKIIDKPLLNKEELKEVLKIRNKNYYEKNKEACKEKSKIYYQLNKEERKKKQMIYYDKMKKAIREKKLNVLKPEYP